MLWRLRLRAYHSGMKADTATPTEFDRFTALVDQMLSVPKVDLERIKQTPVPKPSKSDDGKR